MGIRTMRKPANHVIAPVLLDIPVLSHVDIIPKTRLLYQFYCINKPSTAILIRFQSFHMLFTITLVRHWSVRTLNIVRCYWTTLRYFPFRNSVCRMLFTISTPWRGSAFTTVSRLRYRPATRGILLTHYIIFNMLYIIFSLTFYNWKAHQCCHHQYKYH